MSSLLKRWWWILLVVPAAIGLWRLRIDFDMLMLRQAPLEFEPAADAPLRVSSALPALLAEGLLRHSRKLFVLPEGLYPLETLFLVLAFIALVRVRSLKALRY